ncbi:hypothetical protein AM587_10015611 [Phytophthora nicotianae]|uniref:Uncharacterized protein n=1 Tax=Phytophthora nicotianae TaxID=4792 RepID=A0A0W8CDP7_PHYNI|nr:hypothetical protein AM587_10015611 [Phytophthora nicotianae]
MADAQTLDLFDGLPLDYNFLEGGGDASTDGSMNAGGSNSAPTGAPPAVGFVPPDDQMLLDSDVPGSSPTNMMAPKSEGEDLLTPLSFSFNPNGSTAVGQNYRVAPQHKHKRVRSNPDVLQGFGMANMAPSVITPPVMGANGMGFPQQHNMMPINPVQEGVNELKMKRKRPVNHHSRHHSNPVDLLYNLDQFRVLAQQNKEQQQVPMQVQQQQQQQQNMNPNQGYPNPFASFQDPTNFPAPPQPNMQQFQFQVPPQVASGAVHSLHARRSSLGSNLPPRAAARRRGANRSSGLSMDMSQMNLGFLSVPEEPSIDDLNPHRSPPRRSVSSSASSSCSKKLGSDDANRKLYKCGRCGQPKVGHICTMPDQRNNWTQVDLEVTKGLKVMRINCHIMPVKSKWVAQCDDHEPPQLAAKGGEVKSEEEVEAEPLGL